MKPREVDTCHYENKAPGQHDHTGEELQLQIGACLGIWKERTSDGIARQRGHRDDGKKGPAADAELADIRDLGDYRRGKRDEGTGAKAVEDAKQDGGSTGTGWNPQGQDDHRREGGHGDHGVESTDAISHIAG